MWSWAPTSNSVYGNFPLYGRPSATNIHESATQIGQASQKMEPSAGNTAGMTGAGGKDDYSNRMPLPAGSYLHPNPQQYASLNGYSQPQSEQQQSNYFQSANSYYNGSNSDSLPRQNLQQQPVMMAQNAINGSGCHQVEDSGDTSQQATVEYLYGEEAQKVLQQLQLSQFQQQQLQHQSQSRSPPQVATVNPVVRNKNPPSIPAQALGTASFNNAGDNSQVAAFATDSTGQAGPSGDGAGGQSLEPAAQSQQADAVEPKAKPVMHQIVLPQQQSDQPQATGPHFEISQPRPSPQSKGKKGGTYRKMQDYNQYYFNSYETPPYVTPQPVQPRVQQQQQRLQEQAPRPSRKLSNMPTFHLCGRCTKCKMIQGDISTSSGKNSFTFTKAPSGPVRPTTSSPMARQMSATVFPQY